MTTVTPEAEQQRGAVTESGKLDMAAIQKKWMTIVERHEKKRQSWINRSDKIIKIYADAETSMRAAQRKYCVLWANVQTRLPSWYSRAPKCVVARRYQTPNDDLRTAVQALERVTNIQIVDGKLHESIMSARLDRALPGRGTIWIRYEANDNGQQVTDQRICAEFVGFKDFGHGEARTWEEVDCAWRRTYMTKEKLQSRFGDDVMERCGVTLDYAEKDAPDGERQASIYEIWCKSRKAVYWLARSAREALEVGEPPLDLKGFWPFPKPVYATLTNESCLPTPDYIYYQDQAEEITRLTRRIDKLTDSLKLVGWYPAGPTTDGRSEIERALTPGYENKLIPVPSWAAFSEKGGAGQIQWMPVREVAFILEACVKMRQQLLMDVDQITGINDIERGQSDPNETLGAQQLKSQYGSKRVRDTKDDFVRFAKEACEIFAEIGAEHFTAERLGQLAALPPYAMAPLQTDPATGEPLSNQPPPEPLLDEQTGLPMEAAWVKLLRNQLARDVLIDVETDSTIQPDEDAEKQRRVEMFDAVQKGMAPLVELQQASPQLAAAIVPLWGATMKFMLQGFRAGMELEEIVEETVTQVQGLAKQNVQASQQPPQPDIDQQIEMRKNENAAALKSRELDIKDKQATIDGAAKIAAANKPQIVRPPAQAAR